MNSTKLGLIGFLKKVLFVFLLSAVLYAGFLYLIGLALIKTPQFEKLYLFVPYILMVLGAIIIAFLSKFFGKDGIYISLTVSSVWALLSIIIGIFLKWDMADVPAVVGRLVGQIVLSVIFTYFFQNGKRKKRSSGKFRFSK